MAFRLDRGILLATMFLVGLGLVQVYSSSYIFATEMYQDGLFFFRKQLFFACFAMLALFVVGLLPWRVNERLGWMAFTLATCGIIFTFVPHIGVKVGGAYRWIQMPWGLRFEPAELLRELLRAHLAERERRAFEAEARRQSLDIALTSPARAAPCGGAS